MSPCAITDFETQLLSYKGISDKFVISGPEQIQRVSGDNVLHNLSFNEQFGCFIMKIISE